MGSAPAAKPHEPRRLAPAALAVAWLAAALLAPAPAVATICTADSVPGATLLLPYFEVDLADPNGLTTLFSINNASASATVTHVVVWSDLAVPVMSFNLYLTGYDVQTINLRDLLVHDNLPPTASASQDPTDTISPKGIYSQDISFSSCAGMLPPPAISAAELADVQASLTGRPSPLHGNQCAGRFLGDDVARGYVTVDTVRQCTLRGPADAGYFGPGGDASDQNILWGTWYIVNSAHNLAEGSAMVAIEASATNPATTAPGRYTFYGRYDGWTALDHREPLAASFASQYAAGGAFSGRADLIVWRDTKALPARYDCSAPPASGGPAWYPRGQEGLGVFDEEEHALTPQLFPVLPPPQPPLLVAPAAAQRVKIGGATLPVPFSFGWLYLDLNDSIPAGNPASDPAAGQAWVLTVQSADDRYATAIDAFRLDSSCAASHFGASVSVQ